MLMVGYILVGWLGRNGFRRISAGGKTAEAIQWRLNGGGETAGTIRPHPLLVLSEKVKSEIE